MSQVYKALRLLVPVLMSAILFMQNVILIEDYVQYPTVQQIDVAFESKQNLPSFTFCDRNRYEIVDFYSRVVCNVNAKAHPEYCDRKRLLFSRGKDLYCLTFYSQLLDAKTQQS